MTSLALILLGLAPLLAAGGSPGSIALPPPDRRGTVPLEHALQSRRSVREFTNAPVPLATVAQLLWAAQGVTSGDGRRTAPSAGALYPLELIVVAARVDGLEAGTYRYDPASHSLRRTLAAVDGGALARAAGGQQFVAGAAAVIVIAGVEQRTARKYGGRAARYVAFEAGCAAENLLLEAVTLGVGSVVVGAFDDARVAALLRLGRDETPLAILPIGWPRRGAIPR
ncbi:MAG TPA: SagB/ThcOx family dehydrogenase [Thermoanaerobaculia bacterium]